MHGANTPLPTSATLLPRSLETSSADRKVKAPCARAIAAVPPTPAPCRPASQLIAAMSNDVRPALAATPAAHGYLQNQSFDPFPVLPEKFPTGIPASSRSRTSPSPSCQRLSRFADKLPTH